MNKWEAIAEMAKGNKVTDNNGRAWFAIDNWQQRIICSDGHLYTDDELNSEGWEIYEEKPELKKDPYIGKQVIQKSNTEIKHIITGKDIDGDYYVNTTLLDGGIENIKELYYIEGEDF
jgi:hypothetical protein